MLQGFDLLRMKILRLFRRSIGRLQRLFSAAVARCRRARRVASSLESFSLHSERDCSAFSWKMRLSPNLTDLVWTHAPLPLPAVLHRGLPEVPQLLLKANAAHVACYPARLSWPVQTAAPSCTLLSPAERAPSASSAAELASLPAKSIKFRFFFPLKRSCKLGGSSITSCGRRRFNVFPPSVPPSFEHAASPCQASPLRLCLPMDSIKLLLIRAPSFSSRHCRISEHFLRRCLFAAGPPNP